MFAVSDQQQCCGSTKTSARERIFGLWSCWIHSKRWHHTPVLLASLGVGMMSHLLLSINVYRIDRSVAAKPSGCRGWKEKCKRLFYVIITRIINGSIISLSLHLSVLSVCPLKLHLAVGPSWWPGDSPLRILRDVAGKLSGKGYSDLWQVVHFEQ